MITNRVFSAVKQSLDKATSAEDVLVVAVSGGADSMCLLDITRQIRRRVGKVVVCHLHHGVRTDGSAERDMLLVKGYCDGCGIPFFYRRVDVPSIVAETGKSAELVGRELRYRFFNEVGSCYGSYKILTGANANDSVETVLMHLIRGASVDGLCGIREVNGRVVRPLVGVSRKEIEAYVKGNGVPYSVDPTNLEVEYTRNKVRLELIPYIERNLNPNIVNTLLSSIQSFSEDSETLNRLTERAYQKYLISADRKGREFSLGLLGEDRSIVKRVMLRAVREVLNTAQFSFKTAMIDKLLDSPLTDGRTRQISLSKCLKIVVSKGKIAVVLE